MLLKWDPDGNLSFMIHIAHYNSPYISYPICISQTVQIIMTLDSAINFWDAISTFYSRLKFGLEFTLFKCRYQYDTCLMDYFNKSIILKSSSCMLASSYSHHLKTLDIPFSGKCGILNATGSTDLFHGDHLNIHLDLLNSMWECL